MAVVFEVLKADLPWDSIGKYSISEYFSLPEVKLFIPILFFHFVLLKLGNADKYKLFLKTHYSLATLISGITLYNLYLFVFESSSIVQKLDFSFVDRTHLVLQSYAFCVTLFAFGMSFREISKYKRLVQNEFSDYDMLQVKWLWRFVLMLLPVTLFWGAELMRVMIWPEGQTNLVFLILIFGAFFLYYVSYQAYVHPVFFEKMPKSVLEIKEKTLKPFKESHSCSQELSEKMENLMAENEYFLDYNLTINDFAQKIHMSPRLVSSCINKNMGRNFNEWVNGFRVNRAKDLIEKDKTNRWSIEGIGSEAGFKSRSALYAAFKNELGCSPGEFRKNQSQSF